MPIWTTALRDKPEDYRDFDLELTAPARTAKVTRRVSPQRVFYRPVPKRFRCLEVDLRRSNGNILSSDFWFYGLGMIFIL